MIGHIHLQIDVRDLLILNIDLWNLQRGVQLRVVKRARPVGFYAHHTLGVNVLRFDCLQLFQANSRGC